MVSEWEAGRAGKSRSGFQGGEEKAASFPTAQHSRSDHCGSFPTCCAVQEAGTSHTNSPRSPNRRQISLPLPLAIHSPPSPTNPRRHHLHRQQEIQDFQSVFFFFTPKHSSLSQYQTGSRIRVPREVKSGGGPTSAWKTRLLKANQATLPPPHTQIHTHSNYFAYFDTILAGKPFFSLLLRNQLFFFKS